MLINRHNHPDNPKHERTTLKIKAVTKRKLLKINKIL